MRKIGIGVAVLFLGFVAAFAAVQIESRVQAEKYKVAVRALTRPVQRDLAAAGLPNAAELYLKGPLQSEVPATKEESAAEKAALRRPWSDPDGALAAALGRWAPALDALREGAKRARFDCVADTVAALGVLTAPPKFGGVTRGVRLLLLDGRRAQSEGRDADALADDLAALVVADQFRREKNFALLSQLVSALIVEDAYSPVSDLLSGGKLDAAGYASLRDALRRLDDGDEAGRAVAQSLGQTEEVMALFLQYAQWHAAEASRAGRIADYRRAAEEFSAAVARAADKNWPEDFAKELASRRRYGARPASRSNYGFCMGVSWLRRGAFGDCFVGYPLADYPRYDTVITRLSLARAEVAVLLAAAAVRTREIERRAAPASLAELLPDVLARVPADPYDDFKPVSYAADAAGWRVSSVGPDHLAVSCPRLAFAPPPAPPRRRRAKAGR